MYIITEAQTLMEEEEQILVIKAKEKLMCFSDGGDSPTLLPEQPLDSFRPPAQWSMRQAGAVQKNRVYSTQQHEGTACGKERTSVKCHFDIFNKITKSWDSVQSFRIKTCNEYFNKIKISINFSFLLPSSQFFFFFFPQVLHLREKKQTSFKSLIRLSFQNEISPWPFNPDPCISCLVKSALNYVYANDFRAEETY